MKLKLKQPWMAPHFVKHGIPSVTIVFNTFEDEKEFPDTIAMQIVSENELVLDIVDSVESVEKPPETKVVEQPPE